MYKEAQKKQKCKGRTQIRNKRTVKRIVLIGRIKMSVVLYFKIGQWIRCCSPYSTKRQANTIPNTTRTGNDDVD